MASKQVTVAELIQSAMMTSGKTQREIAEEVGYTKPNVISMMKFGQTKVPISKIPLLAKALGVDPVHFLRVAMIEYHSEVWNTLVDIMGEPLTDNERMLLSIYRNSSDETGREKSVKGEVVSGLREIFKNG